jgi:hypothetical protein
MMHAAGLERLGHLLAGEGGNVAADDDSDE